MRRQVQTPQRKTTMYLATITGNQILDQAEFASNGLDIAAQQHMEIRYDTSPYIRLRMKEPGTRFGGVFGTTYTQKYYCSAYPVVEGKELEIVFYDPDGNREEPNAAFLQIYVISADPT
jgi:hypothetical protein